MVWDKVGKRRVTKEDFRAIDAILDEWGESLPAEAIEQMEQIVRVGVPRKSYVQKKNEGT